MEKWKEPEKYKGQIEVSNYGRVKYLEKEIWNGKAYVAKPEKITYGFDNWIGYKMCAVKEDGKRVQRRVHRLVAECFIPNPECKKEVNHKDLNKKNNNVENLEWCTHRENVQHASYNQARKRKYKVEDIIKDLENKVPIKEITKNREIQHKMVNKIAKEKNLKISKQRVYAIDREEMEKLFEEGIRNKEIAKKYNTNPRLIARYKYLWKKKEKN